MNQDGMHQDDRDEEKREPGEERVLPAEGHAGESGEQEEPFALPSKPKTPGRVHQRLIVRNEIRRRQLEGSKLAEELEPREDVAPQKIKRLPRWGNPEEQDDRRARERETRGEDSSQTPDPVGQDPVAPQGETEQTDQEPLRLRRRGNQRNDGDPWTREPRSSLWWVAVVGCCVVVLGYVMMRGSERSEPTGQAQAQPPGQKSAERENFDPGRAEDWKGALPFEVAKKFTQAKTVAERLELVRDAQRVGPSLTSFFREGPGADEEVAKLISLGPIQTPQFTFLRFEVKMRGGSSRLLCVVLSEGEGARVDFESYARHGSASWTDLLAGEAVEARTVRVIVEVGNYYSHGFAEEEKWRHFAATTPDVEMQLHFYVARGSEVAKRLAGMGILAGGKRRATLAIRSVEGSFANRQFEVTKVLGPGWVMGAEQR